MKKKRRRINFLVSLILLISMFLYGCNNKQEEEQKIDIKSGAIALENLGEYKIYNLTNDKYEKIDTEYLITAYDLKSGNFIYNENGQNKVNYLGKEELIEEGKTVISPKLSIGGDYLAYFIREDYLELKLKDLSKSKEIQINSNVSISGELIDWLDEDTLVYYGIDNDKNNGIFIYNIIDKEEKLLYKLDLGYVEFLKVLDNEIVLVQDKGGKEKLVKVINENGEVTETIKNISDVSDIESNSDGIFILGKLQDNNYSLYKYKEGTIKRLVFDFPKFINLEKGLSKDKDGNITFSGGEDHKQEKIYKCSDDAISMVNGDSGSYHFIRFR